MGVAVAVHNDSAPAPSSLHPLLQAPALHSHALSRNYPRTSDGLLKSALITSGIPDLLLLEEPLYISMSYPSRDGLSAKGTPKGTPKKVHVQWA